MRKTFPCRPEVLSHRKCTFTRKTRYCRCERSPFPSSCVSFSGCLQGPKAALASEIQDLVAAVLSDLVCHLSPIFSGLSLQSYLLWSVASSFPIVCSRKAALSQYRHDVVDAYVVSSSLCLSLFHDAEQTTDCTQTRKLRNCRCVGCRVFLSLCPSL